jgi:hypothetical protein
MYSWLVRHSGEVRITAAVSKGKWEGKTLT